MSLVKCYVHAVWAVKYRRRLLDRERMRGVLVQSVHEMLVARGHYPIITNFEPDHVHSIFGFSMREDISLTMKAVKGGSSRRLNEVFFGADAPFRWQKGYGVFSVCPTHVGSKAQYVRDQQIIHAYRDFLKEYDQLVAEHPPLELHPNDGHVHYFDPLVDA